MTAVTARNSANSHSQQVIHQWLSYTQRHKQPLSVLALTLTDYDSILADIGYERTGLLLQQLGQKLREFCRCEDTLVSAQAGKQMFILLPGTDANGGLAMAERLTRWFADQEFELDDFQVVLATRVALHSTLPGKEQDAASFLNTALNTLKTHNDETPIVLSTLARKQLAEKPEQEATTPLAQQLESLAEQTSMAEFMAVLEPSLTRLDEKSRLELVDYLLEASMQTRTA
ncbi:MAG: diguanylate cyclase [Pseudomonadales bacterium]|nr:diguanylate cyclase [Pseudomonadales bacterium]